MPTCDVVTCEKPATHEGTLGVEGQPQRAVEVAYCESDAVRMPRCWETINKGRDVHKTALIWTLERI